MEVATSLLNVGRVKLSETKECKRVFRSAE